MTPATPARWAAVTALASLLTWSHAFAQLTGYCGPWKETEILCMKYGDKQGVLVDLQPKRPRVTARLSTYWATTALKCQALRSSNDQLIFSQESRHVWYRFNKGYYPVHGGARVADCIQVFISDCAEIMADRSKIARPCPAVLAARGLSF